MFRFGLFNAAGSLVRLLVGTISVPLLIRYLGLENYGIWALLTASIDLVMLSEAGLSVSTTVFVSQDRARNDKSAAANTLAITLTVMLIMATVALSTMWFGAEALLHLFPKLSQEQSTAAIQALRIGGFVVFVRLLQLVLIGFQQAHERYLLVNIIQSIQAVMLYTGLVLIARSGADAISMMLWYVVSSFGVFIILAVATWLLLRGARVRITLDFEKAKAIVQFAFMSGVTSIGGRLFSQGDRLVVGAVLGPELLGAYAGITAITQKINALSGTVVQPLLPGLSSTWAARETDYGKVKEQVLEAFELSAIVSLGLGGVLLVMSPFILRTAISGQDIGLYSTGFRMATIIYSLYSLNAVGYYILFATDYVSRNLFIVLGSGILSLLLIGAGAERFGLIGAILGNMGYLATLTLLVLGMSRTGVSRRVWIRSLVWPLVCFFAVALGTFLLNGFLGHLILLIGQLTVLFIWFFRGRKHPLLFIDRLGKVHEHEPSGERAHMEL